MTTPFDEFVGKRVKAPYKDGGQFKIAKGILVTARQGFVKITGELGTIIIHQNNIEKMSPWMEALPDKHERE